MANLIQITDQGEIDDRWFLHCQQYTYEDISLRELDIVCERCKTKKQWVKCYRVVIDDVDYYIPTTMAIETDKVLTDDEQYVQRTWLKRLVTDELTDENGITDYVSGTKKYLGINIAAKKRSDQADYANEGYVNTQDNQESEATTRGEEVGQ